MADAPMLTSARVLVVGASAGIGRALAGSAIAQGAQVCVAARRGDALESLCAEAGGGTPLAGDLTDPASCARIVAGAVVAMGGIDLLVHAAGTGTMQRIEQTDAETWSRIYAVNVIGPTVLTAAALPHLSADAVVAFLSSESAGEIRWGMGPYAASKAALDLTIRQWRAEHPERRFMRVVMGATMPTEFGNSFDGEVLTVAFDRWKAAGIDFMVAMETEDVGRHLAESFAVVLAHPSIDIPDLRFDTRGEAWPS
jgi:NAD(P)-dependent dehydrogenase (short-subunit alcohol dehydrogenase family)